MVTIYDVAKKCGCSASTVSKVVNNYTSIPVSTRNRILNAMKEMNYIPDTSAKILSTGSSKNVGVLSYFALSISPFKQPLFMEILDSFQKEMNDKKYDLIFISRIVAGRNESFYKNCVSRHVDGAVLLGEIQKPEMQEVIKSNLPAVGFDYLGKDMIGVTSNNFAITKDLVNYLLNLGHRKIIYIHGDTSDITRIRMQAFKSAITEFGLDFDDKMLIQSNYLSIDDIKQTLHDIMKQKDHPTAIMFPDDTSAIYGIQYLDSLGFRCPDDISITGFDGISISQITTPKLTTVRQDSEAIGKALAQKLIESINDKKKTQEIIEIPASLIIGNSTKKIN